MGILNIFGTDHSAEDKLKSQLDPLREKQKAGIQDLTDYINGIAAQNGQQWNDYAGGESAYAKQLADVLDANKSAYSNLATGLGKYSNVEDLFKGPAEQATQDPQDRLNVQANLGKIGKLTGLQETPEEQLMRMTARQQQESDLKSQRDSMAQSLKERGVYGGGAELASALGAQQEAAGRRSLEDVAANANAQKRAMVMLGQYQSGAQAANNADQALQQFNASMRQQHTQARSGARTADNSAQQGRAQVLNQAATAVNNQQAGNATQVRADQRAIVGGQTQSNLANAGLKTGVVNAQNELAGQTQAQLIAEQPRQGIFDSFLKL